MLLDMDTSLAKMASYTLTKVRLLLLWKLLKRLNELFSKRIEPN